MTVRPQSNSSSFLPCGVRGRLGGHSVKLLTCLRSWYPNLRMRLYLHVPNAPKLIIVCEKRMSLLCIQ
jgi:hypothetical protein